MKKAELGLPILRLVKILFLSFNFFLSEGPPAREEGRVGITLFMFYNFLKAFIPEREEGRPWGVLVVFLFELA